MDFRQLRGAVELARLGSFSKAAERLGIAQPAMSQSISALERELGVRLFNRSSRRVTLTDAGVAFVNQAAGILGNMAALHATMTQHAGALRGRVDVASTLFFGQSALPELVAAFSRDHPGVRIVIDNDVTPNIVARLSSGQLDVGFASVPDREPAPDLLVEVLHDDEIIIMVPPNHRLANEPIVAFADLCDEPFIGYGEGLGVGSIQTALAREAGFELQIVVESRSAFLVRSLVAQGLGVSIGMKEYAVSPGAGIAVVPLMPRRRVTTALLTRRDIDVNPAARAFAELARSRYNRVV